MKINYGDPKFDLRTLPRALREKQITPQDFDGYLKKLPDEAQHAEEIHFHETKAPSPPKKPKGKSKGPAFALANEEAEATQLIK